MNYWLHRISYHQESAYPLLEKGFLTIGFSDFASQEFIDRVLQGDTWEPRWQALEEEFDEIWGKRPRNRHTLWRFIEGFKKNDWIVVPSWGTFYIYELISEKPQPIGNLKLTEVKDWSGNTLSIKDGLLHNGKQAIDLGFFWEVKLIAKGISRAKYADEALKTKMNFRSVNVCISDIASSIKNALAAFLTEKPTNTNPQLDDNVEADINMLQQIDSLKVEIDKHRPLSPELEQRIMAKFRLDWNYHSNNIEGNKLTYGETRTFLLHGITAKGKLLKDHLDIKGHNEALLMLEDIIRAKEGRGITEIFIRELHTLILGESYYNPAMTSDGIPTQRKIEVGKYKTQPNHVQSVTGEIHRFASPEETPAKMGDLIDWYRKANEDWDKNEESNNHPLVVAALFHYQFISIHPFDDGNGRLARILMNLILMQYGYPPIIIKTEKKEDYYTALKEADGGNLANFVKYIAEQLINSMNLYIKGANGEDIEEDTDLDKQIELLKASLSGEKEKVTISKEQGLAIYNKLIKPIMEKTLNKLSKFDDLFFRKEIMVWTFGGGSPVNDKEVFIRTLDEKINAIESIIGEIGFEYRLKEFKKIANINFDSSVELCFSYEKYDNVKIYSKPTTFREILVPYTAPEISDEEIKRIVNGVAKNILDKITENMRKDS